MRKLLFIASTLILISLLIFWLLPKSNPHLSQYLDPDYAKHVELQAYIMTPEQVATLFATNPNDNPEHWTVDDAPKIDPSTPLAKHSLFFEPLYLVIRLKNTGHKPAWGSLICHLPFGGEIEPQIYCLKPLNHKYQNLTLPIYPHGIRYETFNRKSPVVTWQNLYTHTTKAD